MAGVPCGRQRSSEGACALEWDGDGAAQQGSSAAAAGAARQQRGSGAAVRACALEWLRARWENRESEGGGERESRERKRFDFKFSQNFQLDHEKV